MDKNESLKDLEAEMAADASLPLSTNLVFGEGDPDCAVLFIGEAPGRTEDMEKRPFVGRGGQLLREMIRSIGWREQDVYITNIVKRRPPENRDPLPEEIAAYRPYLTQQIGIIDPKIIVALGRFSMNYFLPEGKITRDQGKAFRVLGRIVYPVLHPAAALRSPDAMKAFRESFAKLPDVVRNGAPAIDLPPAHEEKKPEKPPQASLF